VHASPTLLSVVVICLPARIASVKQQQLAVFIPLLTFLIFFFAANALFSQQTTSNAPEKIIIDTDIGDDIDDAFALALALKSPELRILGVATGFGDTEARAKIVDRFFGETGHADIPVLAGKPTATKNPMSQKAYGDGGHFAKASHGDAVEFLLAQIKRYPGEITLIAIGPLMNIGTAIDKDAATFRKLKRVVLMGGCIKRG
jgi:purine nucleosidase